MKRTKPKPRLAAPAGPPIDLKTLDDVRMMDKNPNRVREEIVELVRSSLEELGGGRAPLVDRAGQVIAGEKTIRAAQKLGLQVVPVHIKGGQLAVVVRDDLDATSLAGRRMAVMDNEAGRRGLAWDVDVLRDFQTEGIDLAGIFPDGYLERLLANVPELEPNEAPAEVELAKSRTIDTNSHRVDLEMIEGLVKKYGTKAGQLWLIAGGSGRTHRLVCGSTVNAEDVSKATDGKPVPLIVSDPPYCSGGFQEAGKRAGTWGDIASDNLSTRGYVSLLQRMLEAVRPQAAYLFTDWRMWIPLFDLVESGGLAVRSMLVWDKGSPGLGGLWRPQHEIVMYASRQGAKRIKGEGAVGNVLSFKRSGNDNHYTEKPVDLLSTMIHNDRCSGRKGAPVYDGFTGSGSTLIAAERCGREFMGTEIEKGWVAMALERCERDGMKPRLA